MKNEPPDKYGFLPYSIFKKVKCGQKAKRHHFGYKHSEKIAENEELLSGTDLLY